MRTQGYQWADRGSKPGVEGPLFRVQVEHLLADGSAAYFTQYRGPYTTLAAAKAVLTRELKSGGVGGRKVRGVVQTTATNWKAAA